MTGILRAPEVLGVDTALLAAKAAFLRSPDGGGLSGTEVASLFVREPTALLSALPRVQETVGWLRRAAGSCVQLLDGMPFAVSRAPVHAPPAATC